MDSLCYYTHSQTEPINKGLEPIYPSSTSWDPIDTGDIHHPASFTPQSVQYNSFSQDATATESQDSFSQDDLASVSQHTHSELGAGDSSMQDTICGINLNCDSGERGTWATRSVDWDSGEVTEIRTHFNDDPIALRWEVTELPSHLSDDPVALRYHIKILHAALEEARDRERIAQAREREAYRRERIALEQQDGFQKHVTQAFSDVATILRRSEQRHR